ncbi:Flp family type IVb pilin [Amphritea balenae]|uniref:Flp family type IVb pilin n=1 Tax=Amphritea balenae TaxID=452629 RepID=A0A3P1SW32_9GAMM|nr:Flp family type IVb pilin [Amphritea balenae]RRD01175.1 Flp family type IVb pilin [Amphritea balenae]GGK59321.1 hypothetical protein GCM10007941_06940 [Amphritea balenae]
MTIQTLKQQIKLFIQDEDGLTTVEYAIAGGLVGAAVILAFRNLGTAVNGEITGITNAINAT